MNKNKMINTIINVENAFENKRREYHKYEELKSRFSLDLINNDTKYLHQISNDIKGIIAKVKEKDYKYLHNNLKNTLNRVDRLIKAKENGKE